MFGDRVIATAILDRLHHAVTLNIRGNAYRLTEKAQGRSDPVTRRQQFPTRWGKLDCRASLCRTQPSNICKKISYIIEIS